MARFHRGVFNVKKKKKRKKGAAGSAGRYFDGMIDAEAGPLVGHAQKVAVHGVAEAGAVQLGRHHRRHFALAAQNTRRLDERLQPLVPRERSNVV